MVYDQSILLSISRDGVSITAVYKNPNRQQTQTLILGFRISETHSKKEKKEKGRRNVLRIL